MLDFDLSNRFIRGTKLSHRNTLRQFCPRRDRCTFYKAVSAGTKLSQQISVGGGS